MWTSVPQIVDERYPDHPDGRSVHQLRLQPQTRPVGHRPEAPGVLYGCQLLSRGSLAWRPHAAFASKANR